MTTALESKNEKSPPKDSTGGWRNYLVLAPIMLSGVLWLMSLETRLHEDGSRLVSIVQQINAIEIRVRANEVAVEDPRPKPETAVAMEAMKKTLEERGDRINKLEERINGFDSIVLQSFFGRASSQPSKR